MLLENSGDYISEKMGESFSERDLLDETLTLLLGHDAIFHPGYPVRRTRQVAMDRFECTRQVMLKWTDDGASVDQYAAMNLNRLNPAMVGMFTDLFGQTVEAVITANGCRLTINRTGIASEELLQRRDGDYIDGEKYTPKWLQQVRKAEWRPNRHFKNRQRRYYKELEKQHSEN